MDLTGTQQPFSFPLLKNQEILQCLSEAGLGVTLDVLTEPNRHKESVKSIFASLLQITLALDKDSFAQCSESAIKKRDELSFSELHLDSFSNLKFLKLCMKLMKICGIYNDFGFQDLHSPTPPRLRRQLSAAINFIKFREDKLNFYAELHQGRKELLAGLIEVNEEYATLENQLKETQLAAEGRWNEAKEVDNDCSELEAEIAQQNKIQAAIRDESTQLKKQSNQLKDTIATTSLAIQEVEAQEKRIQQQVVKSPEKIKARSAELRKELEATQAECQSSEKEIELNKIRIANVSRALTDTSEAIKLAEEVKEAQEKLKIATEKVDHVKSKHAKCEKEVISLGAIFEEKQKELNLVEKNIEDNREHFKTKMEAAQVPWNAANGELLSLEKDRRDGRARLEAGEEEVRILQQIIEEEQQRTKNEMSEMISKYKEIEKCIIAQNEEFIAALGA